MQWSEELGNVSSKKSKKQKYKENEEDAIVDLKIKKKKSKKDKIKEVYEEEDEIDIEDHYDPEIKSEYEEHYDNDKIHLEVKEEVHPTNDPEWPKEHILELIKKMEEQIPENDHLRFTSRVEKIDWSTIQFGTYSAEDCCNKWKFINKKIRSYRLLQEVLQDAKIWAEKPWSNFYGRGKKGKHPDQPNRPLSSYMLFYMKKKNKIAKQNPNLKMTEISKIIGEKYNALPKYKKDMYVKMAKELQDGYKRDLDEFYNKHPEAAPQQSQVKNYKKGLKDAPGFDKPLPPFKLFCNEKLKKHEDDENFDKHAFLEKCKEQWRNLSIKKKVVWIKWAQEAENKYLDELSAYASAREESMPVYKSVITKDEKAMLERMAGKPEKPPNSAYSLFSRLMLKSEKMKHFNEPPRNRMQEIARQWKLMPAEEKNKYAEQVQHMLETYKLDYATYLESLPEDKRAEELSKSAPKRKAISKVSKKTQEKTATKPKLFKEKVFFSKLFKGEPEKPPGTIFESFVQQFKKDNAHLPPTSVAIKAAAQWKMLNENEREKYQRKHEQAKRKYMQDYEAFLKTLNEDELKEYSEFKNARSQESSGSESEEDSSDSEGDSDQDSESDSAEKDSGSNEDSDSDT